MNHIKVAIVDDSKAYRDSLKEILRKDNRIQLHNEYDSGAAFILTLKSPFQPDVCLIDVVLKDMSGIECGKRIKAIHPHIHVIIMTAYPDAESFSEARKIGADYVEKGPRLNALMDHIIVTSVTSQKEKLISLKSNGKLKISHIDLINELDALEKRVANLSHNQIKVLMLRKKHKSVKEIARIMGVEPGTVHTHLKRALKKLNIPNLLDYIISE